MAEEIITQDPQGQSSVTPDPSQDQDGQSSTKTIQQIQEDLPEKFKGKSAKEIAESYVALEKKVGEHSKEVQTARQNLAQWETLGKVIQANPALEKLIIEEISKINNPKDSSTNESNTVTRDDTRIAVESEIVQRFESEFGINKLGNEQKNDLQKRIGKELEEMLDPKGEKLASQLVAEIPLNKLSMLLRKAYRLATADDEKERARVKGLLEARENRDAEFGTIPSSSTSSSRQNQLSEDEKKVARKLHITEEQYLKNKQELAQ